MGWEGVEMLRGVEMEVFKEFVGNSSCQRMLLSSDGILPGMNPKGVLPLRTKREPTAIGFLVTDLIADWTIDRDKASAMLQASSKINSCT